MLSLLAPTLASLVLVALPTVEAAQAQTFSPPSISPVHASGNYTGASNTTIVNSPLVPGASFDRFIQIFLENTDYKTAASSEVFQSLASQGVLLDGYYGSTHPSEPNYIAAVAGSFFGLGDDSFVALPSNVSTIVDLLEAKNISWASYQENMPYDGYTGFNYTSHNYINPSAPDYTYYVRKHNPLIITDSVASIEARALRIRNFNDFAVDVNASALPQWNFITPNLVNDAHDTTIDFASDWLNYFLVPLLQNPNFNNNRTLILLTFDETETYSVNNNIFTIALGGAVPAALVGTKDSTYYTHYSSLSTVQNNWGLGSLGRGDTDKVLANVYSWVAKATGYVNNGLLGNSSGIPLTNITGTIPGPLNPEYWVPVTAPNVTAIGAGGGPVFIYPGTNLSLTQANAPAPMNLTALGIINPESINPNYNYASGKSQSSSVTAAGSMGTATTKVAPGDRVSAAVGAILIAALGLFSV